MSATQPTPPDAAQDYLAWKAWHAEEFGTVSRGDRRYFAWLLAQLRLTQPVGEVLEIGFGNGRFLGWAHERGWRTSGVETEARLIERARQAGVNAVDDVLRLPEQPGFDLIVALDVLEHVPPGQLPALMTALVRRLRPTGAIVVRVPNGESPLGRMNQHGDRTHLATLGAGQFRQLGQPLNLGVRLLGEAPFHAMQHAGRSPRNLLRAVFRRGIERLVAFAYGWDVEAMPPNALIVLQPRAALPAAAARAQASASPR